MKLKFLFFLLLAIIPASLASGQTDSKKITITGTVMDASQYPVQGAEILIDGNKSGVSSNKKGMYKIKVKSTVKKIGIYTLPPAVIQEAVDGRTSINFTLNDSIVKQIYKLKNAYGEETVNVGYGTQKRKNLTTSVGKIDGRQARFASYTSIFDMIRGELPGVVVSGTSVRIREASSIVGGSDPLFIVDGTPVSSIESVEPQSVKSIEVLKGSAASIYGTRGSNGVIIITLKDGKMAK
jgi:TonB-dependent SusC/RagA subfamily outer membrane receptor